MFLPSWKMMEFVNGKDDNPCMKWKITNVWNHQPDNPVYNHQSTGALKTAQLKKKSWNHGLTARKLPGWDKFQSLWKKMRDDPWWSQFHPFVFSLFCGYLGSSSRSGKEQKKETSNSNDLVTECCNLRVSWSDIQHCPATKVGHHKLNNKSIL